MSFKVDYDALDSFYYSVSAEAGEWMTELENIQTAVQTLIDTTDMSGAGAEAVKGYISAVHMSTLGTISQLIGLHMQFLTAYKADYSTNIDSALHAFIDSQELDSISSEIEGHRQRAITIDENVEYALNQIRDIFRYSFTDVAAVDAAHTQITDAITTLGEDILSLETKHCNEDFDASGDSITALNSFISEMLAKNRSYISGFDPAKLAVTKSYQELYASSVKMAEVSQANQQRFELAYQSEEEHVKALQAEYEAYLERQEKAKWINGIVTGVCIVASVAVIFASGGLAATVIVAGATGALSAGASNATAQYVEKGSWGSVDYGSVCGDAVVGGITGAVTSYVAIGVGDKIITGARSLGSVNAALNSSNAFIRIGTAAGVGSLSSVGSGIITRGAAEAIDQVYHGEFDGGELVEKMLDGKRMAIDAVTGGVQQGVQEYKQYKADMPVREYNDKHNPIEKAQEKGYDVKASDRNGTLEYSGTEYIKTNADGDEIIVTIEATGSRSEDFKVAWEKAAEQYGISKADYENVTWQHMDDYEVRNNTFTLELVDRKAHININHSGGCKQYEVANGVKYK